ncbi:MAG: hypothetical protein LBJ19_02585 [Holosporaceae bacterium]|jgi:hypothetical protein|nr:hypothetical protein [Holosporaceae bacterium]
MKKVLFSGFVALVGLSAALADSVSATAGADFTPPAEEATVSDSGDSSGGDSNELGRTGWKFYVGLNYNAIAEGCWDYKVNDPDHQVVSAVDTTTQAVDQISKSSAKLPNFGAFLAFDYSKAISERVALGVGASLTLSKVKRSNAKNKSAADHLLVGLDQATWINFIDGVLTNNNNAVLNSTFMHQDPGLNTLSINGVVPAVYVKLNCKVTPAIDCYAKLGAARISGKTDVSGWFCEITGQNYNLMPLHVVTSGNKIVPLIAVGGSYACSSRLGVGAEVEYRFAAKSGNNYTISKGAVDFRLFGQFSFPSSSAS